MNKLIRRFRTLLELIIAFIISKKFIWNFINRSAIKKFNMHALKLSKKEEILLQNIKKYGFATTDLNFFGDKFLNDIQFFKKKCVPLESNIKTFLTYYLGGNFQTSRQSFNESNPLLEFALNDKLTSIINYYFGMLARLTYLEINETHITKLNQTMMSQNFHKDPGIHKCIKVFIYLNDVKLENGPFTYVKFSHKQNKDYMKQKRFGAGGVYPKDLDFEKLINKNDIVPICGKAGTVIIADTTGLHCGGNSIKKTRQMATIGYYPPGDLKKSKVDINIINFDHLFPNLNYLIPRKQRKT